jgi:hypothetical protein
MRSAWTRSTITASRAGSSASSTEETRQGHCRTPAGSRVGGATSTTCAPSVASSATFDRATRLCRTSPTIPIRFPAIAPSRSRIVAASSSACVGCSCVPSPALTIDVASPTQPANRCAAPEAGWRTTMQSAPIADSVSAVSRSDSPLPTLDPDAETLIVSALIHLPAASKETRVRVEFS